MGKRDRKEKILSVILDSAHPIKVEEIAKKTGYSLSTVRREIRSLEELLLSNGIEFKYVPYEGIYISLRGKPRNEVFALLSEEEQISNRERYRSMLFELLSSNEKITLEYWEEKLNISHPTVVKDFQEAKKWILRHRLSVVSKPHYGIRLVGEEKFIRQAILDLILENLSEEEKDKLLNELLLNYRAGDSLKDVFPSSFFGIIKFVNEIENLYDVKFTDDSFLQLLLIIGISINRLKKGYKLHDIDLNGYDMSLPFDILEDLYEINFEDTERRFTTLYILSSELESGKTFLKEDKDLKSIIEKEIFNSYSPKNNLFRIFISHLQTAIFKIRNNISIHNPMLEKIKKNYPVLYYIASELSKALGERYGVKIPDEEKGYMTLYLLRLFEGIARKKKIVIICPSGVVTVNLLAEKIKNIFHDVEIVKITSVRELPRVKSKGFIYVSTIPLSNFEGPYFQISPLFSKEEEEKLKNYIYNFYKEEVNLNIIEIKNESEIFQYTPEDSVIVPLFKNLYWVFSKSEPQEEKFTLFYNPANNDYFVYIHFFDYFKTVWLSQRIVSKLSLKNSHKIGEDYLRKLLNSIERGF
ncbi:PRD domain-containing protein [Fervidobacterium pennivorans subsp. shakshaketiis]|uniref:BglG family transcription antiterminator n=1 Tax=Fervidobacterium pennivorans TaxID=93466 RepID=UPI00355C6252